MMITHQEALAILSEHGIPDGWHPTAWWPGTDTIDPDSTFYQALGIKVEYDRRDVYVWLGY